MSRGLRRGGMTGLVGRDLVDRRRPQRSWRGRPTALALAVLLALGVAGLRVDQIRMQLALGDALRQVQALEDRQRALLARLQTLRAPARLQALAGDLGLRPPERSVDLRGKAGDGAREGAAPSPRVMAADRLAAALDAR